jgi:hypothetical protein
VQQRIAELQNKVAIKVEITLAGQLAKLEEDRQPAIKLKQVSAAVRAVELQSKLSGLLVERREVVKTPPTGPELAADQWAMTHCPSDNT